MSPFELDPLDPALADLLSDDQAVCGHERAPEASKARVMRRIELVMAGLVPVAAQPHMPARPRAPDSRAPGRGGAHTVEGALSPFAKRLVATLASFAVGSGAGAGVMHWHDARVAADAPVSTQTAHAPLVAAAEPPAAPAAEPVPTVSIAPSATAPPSAPRLVPPSVPSSATLLEEDPAAERILLDEARASLMRGENDKAVSPLLQHARRYPRGRLLEEREALLIQALTRSGRSAEAKERSARFEQRFPGSLFMTAVEDAVSTIPDK